MHLKIKGAIYKDTKPLTWGLSQEAYLLKFGVLQHKFPCLFTNVCIIWGRLVLRRCSYFVIMNMTFEALTSYISLPITADLFIGHITTSPQDYGTIYLIVLGEPHLLMF